MPRYKLYFPFWMIILLFLVALPVYIIKFYSYVRIEPDSGNIGINFFIPMRRDSVVRATIIPEIPKTPVSYSIKWLNSTTLILKIDQKGDPEGQLLTYKINDIPTVIPFIKKSVEGKVRNQVPIILLKNDLKNISTQGPVTISFNTPVDPESLKKFIVLPLPGMLKPFNLTYRDKIYNDYSRWRYIPDKPFENNTTYRISIQPGIRSMGGSLLDKQGEIVFTTASKPKVISSSPTNSDSGVSLFRNIEFILDQEVSTAQVKVTDTEKAIEVPGKTEIKRSTVIFRPSYVFLPNSNYKAVIQAESVEHESLYEYEISFSTVDIGEKTWVEVKLGDTHTVTVYKGNQRIRHMLASGGRPECPTPMGYFYTKDRGQSFWSYRFGEGASYWVRLVGQILVHSVPKDSRWQTKKDEHAKLGMPASHGCIRLDEKDAKWFFENIPKGTLVIIHQ